MRRWLAGLVLLAATGVGCFSPRQPVCAFSCATEPHACPANYQCGDDGICHRDGVNDDGATCPLDDTSDAGTGGEAGFADAAMQ